MDSVHPDLLRFLKEHQKEAIKFLFDRVIGKNGTVTARSGAILAHCMGLGKSFAIITFLHAVLSNDVTSKKISRVLIVCPKNVIAHWEKEIKNWIDCPGRRLADNIQISCISSTSKDTRFYDVRQWSETTDKKQILIIGYEMFGNLIKSGGEMKNFLQNPGADLAVFDEAHRLKNDESIGYQLISKIRTYRKIFLTGTPFQNDVMEYYNIVHLISPKLFVSKDRFRKDFSLPIDKGRSKDACPGDVKKMQVLCKVLYKKTKDIIHRKGVKVLTDEIGIEKEEVTFMVRPSKLQKKLVEAYLNRINPETGKAPPKNAVKDHPVVSRILTHPSLFYEYEKTNPNKTIQWMNATTQIDTQNESSIELSNKLMLLIQIIKYSEKVGDKILVFSQYVLTLNFIEATLKRVSEEWKNQSKNGWGWSRGKDYLRIDGGVDSYSRHAYQDIFNKSSNPRCRLLLISTKAGSLGTNMIGANRVVIFDACWNPTHDIQSLYRVYRLGQTKPVFIYRLVTSGTVEEIVYNRQIAKEATGHRVIDEADIDRHFTREELKHLYRFKYVPEDEPPIIKGNFNDSLTAIVAVVSHDSFFDEFNEDEVSEDEVSKFEEIYDNKK
uniref:Uncharacterized protein n=1 Tax=Panagrolaimus sp. PS1159 TaxID=55785 RepID=A0AC35FBG7_9BILA